MRRALETASPIAEQFGVALKNRSQVAERMNWDDQAVESIEDFLDEWRATSHDRSYRPRRGDSSRQAASRFLAVLADIAADRPAGRAIVVTNGGVTTDLLRVEFRAIRPVARPSPYPALESGGRDGPARRNHESG